MVYRVTRLRLHHCWYRCENESRRPPHALIIAMTVQEFLVFFFACSYERDAIIENPDLAMVTTILPSADRMSCRSTALGTMWQKPIQKTFLRLREQIRKSSLSVGIGLVETQGLANSRLRTHTQKITVAAIQMALMKVGRIG